MNLDEYIRVYNEASELLITILIMAYNTGMRRGEILNLTWKNVDLAEGYIRVEETKTDEPRNIPINKQLYEILKSVKYNSSGEYVFSRGEEPVRCFKTSFDKAVKRSGVEMFTFHDLRHTFASNLVMNGVDLATVQELLGHKNIIMTKRYSHPTPDYKKRAVDTLNLDCLDTYMDTKVVSIESKTDVSA